MRRLSCFPLLIMITVLMSPAWAGTKEELARLQSDVLALQNQMRLLEKTFREQTDNLKSLVVQLNDQVGQSNVILKKVSAVIENQAAGDKTASQTLLQEIRNLSAKVDDSATRISALAQQVADMKVQTKPISQRQYQTAPSDSNALALSADAIYNEAFNDLVQGNFDLAVEGFSAFIKNFPSNEKADDAQYNIGEAFYNSNKLPQAIAAFTRVIDDYPSGDKIASAYFKRGKAEMASQDKESAIEDFKTVVQNFGATPEASLAKTELDGLGVALTKPARSSPVRRRPR
jgi:tol-pal system protein YbgF